MTDPEILKRIIIVFKYLKAVKGLNQKQLSLEFGVSESTITRLQNGQNVVTPRFLKQLKSIFEISDDWILTGQGEMLLNKQDLGSVIELEEDLKLLRRIRKKAGLSDLIEVLLKLSGRNLSAVKALAEKLRPE
ncbi:helix-turn-helix domain-containing protein [Leptospira gomenensis]|uniref:Helix-turn-helix domain-containing protein n=1 Tax=Leptospira gomenensis TaxID=2484974 RepID=A0A5F1YHQ0_9LEPT|nr:helix-turn-helix transcriptional regulator [Leptospira gomenensis]TGK39185.1 helix-turn-helix domain-containing protein [Leptospira gomenensis]TGK44274.1 helix-turn-helix domain-containing protein [Leptospira gomenensis]TGK65136.1 helix-turn-helix domain-containing protein [Leptospira gomenensis]